MKIFRPTPRIAILVSALLMALVSASCGGGSLGPASADDADPGRDAWVVSDEMGGIYKTNCAVCHGKDFAGSSLGPSLLKEPLTHGASLDDLVASIAKGYPDKRMPGWEGNLSQADIRGIAILLLEKREGDRGDAGQGIGPAPVIPEEVINTTHADFRIEKVYGGLVEPYSIAPLPDGRILVTEKMRGMSIVSEDGENATLVSGMPKAWDDAELRGTAYAGMGWAHEAALHPEYTKNGWIYYSFGDRCEGCNTVSVETGRPVAMLKLVRGRLDGSKWIDQETIWEAPKDTYVDGLENGTSARIAFDDAGHVYLTMGTMTDYRGIQSLAKPYGKTIRMHDDGRVPADNPFVNVPGALPGIYTLGHRNAQGLAFDRSTGLLWSSEHGPRGGDEGNLIRSGLNYGWPLVSLGVDYDGRPIHYAEEYGIEFDPADLEPPVIDWTPSPGVSSIVFYEGAAFPAWRNNMIVATLAKNDLWRYVVTEEGTVESETLIRGLGRFRDVEVDREGNLLVLLEHRAGSRILRIVPAK